LYGVGKVLANSRLTASRTADQANPRSALIVSMSRIGFAIFRLLTMAAADRQSSNSGGSGRSRGSPRSTDSLSPIGLSRSTSTCSSSI
jgi:hypothetical protein